MVRRRVSRPVRYVLLYSVLIISVVSITFPLAWIISTSLKTPGETTRIPPTWIPLKPTVQAYIQVWRVHPFGRYILNSTVVATATTLLCTILSVLAGYGFSRFRFAGEKVAYLGILSTQMFPEVLLVVPYFVMMRKANLVNSYPSLIFAYTSFALPFCIWMTRGFFDSVPREVDQAALIDGCSRLSALVYVVIPLAIPGTVATMVFSFLLSWNHFLFALCLTNTPDMFPLSVGIASFMGQYLSSWDQLMAAATIAIVPVIVVYSCLERYLVEGLTAGAIKG